MIFSRCHTNNLAEFVQLLGRACGHKKYCESINIIGHNGAFENAKAFVTHILELKDENVRELTKDNMLTDGIKKSIVIWRVFGSQINLSIVIVVGVTIFVDSNRHGIYSTVL